MEAAAKLLSSTTKSTLLLTKHLGEEGAEIMCRAVNDALTDTVYRQLNAVVDLKVGEPDIAF